MCDKEGEISTHCVTRDVQFPWQLQPDPPTPEVCDPTLDFDRVATSRFEQPFEGHFASKRGINVVIFCLEFTEL